MVKYDIRFSNIESNFWGINPPWSWASLWLRGKESACSAGDTGLIPGWGKYPGEGNGYPLQYSCLENPVNRGAWRATTHRVTKSRTRLKQLGHNGILLMDWWIWFAVILLKTLKLHAIFYTFVFFHYSCSVSVLNLFWLQ